MVNPGHRSRGCTTCRLRRVKCDESWPVCSRCQRSRRACLGYAGHMLKIDTQKSRIDPAPPLETFKWHRISCATEDTSLAMQLLVLFGVREEHLQHPLVQSTADVIDAGLRALQQCSITRSERRLLLQQYQTAIRQLRLAQTGNYDTDLSYVPAYFMALYEVTVEVTPGETAWRVHLEGLLAILDRPNINTISIRRRTFVHALRVVRQDKDTGQTSADHITSDIDEAYSLLDVAKLRLRHVSTNISTHSQGNLFARKLDASKARIDLIRIRRDLQLLPTLLSENRSQDLHPLQDEQRVVLLIVETLLLNIGQHLQPTSYITSKEYAEFTCTVSFTATSICDELALKWSHDNTFTADCTELVNALFDMWSLSAVLQAFEIADSCRATARQMLERIGEIARIPKASALASSSERNFSDVISGIVLISLLYNEGVQG